MPESEFTGDPPEKDKSQHPERVGSKEDKVRREAKAMPTLPSCF